MTSITLYDENRVFRDAIRDDGITDCDKKVFQLVLDGTKRKLGYCCYSLRRMAEILSISLRQVCYSIKRLVARGYLHKFRVPGYFNNCYGVARPEEDKNDKAGVAKPCNEGCCKTVQPIEGKVPTSLRSVGPSLREDTEEEARGREGRAVAPPAPPPRHSGSPVGEEEAAPRRTLLGEPSPWDEWEGRALALARTEPGREEPPWLQLARTRGFDAERLAQAVAKCVLYLKRGNALRWVGRRYAEGKLAAWIERERLTTREAVAGYRRMPAYYDASAEDLEDLASGALYNPSYKSDRTERPAPRVASGKSAGAWG